MGSRTKKIVMQTINVLILQSRLSTVASSMNPDCASCVFQLSIKTVILLITLEINLHIAYSSKHERNRIHIVICKE